MLTKQEIFNTVAKHLLTQNAQSENGDGLCVYRSPNGLMCAAGVLIKDEFYSPKLEKKLAVNGVVATALIRSGVDMTNSETSDIVLELQKLHDFSMVEDWETGLTRLAIQFDLDYGVVTSMRS